MVLEIPPVDFYINHPVDPLPFCGTMNPQESKLSIGMN